MLARYRGRCNGCRDPIEPGDEIDPDPEREGYVHRRCAVTLTPRRPDRRRRCLDCADLIEDGRCINCGKAQDG
jgi:hypothetical protein